MCIHQFTRRFVRRRLYALFHTFRYSTYATIAVTLSVQTNAHHTPVTPMRRLKTNAAGMITATYRITEITREGANGDNANVTKDAVVGALGFTPIGADDVPVKSVNGATGEVKSTFYVTVTPTGSGYAATADKTAAEVYAAYVAGYAVYAIVNFSGIKAPFELPLAAAASISDTIVLGFGALGSLDPTAKPQYPTVTYTGTAWMAWLGTLARSEDIPTIPAITAADNGKILRVVNGAWAAAELLSAGGASF